MRSVTVTLVPGFKFQQAVGNGRHTVISDIAVADGGADGGLDPKELVLGGLGACTAMTIMMVAPRRNWDIQSLTVKVTQDEEDDPDNAGKKRLVVTEEIEVTGNVSAAELDAIKRTAGHCPVYKLLTEPKRVVTNMVHHAPAATTSGAGAASTAGETTTKADVAQQFARTAQAYATSAGHARGSDLAIVLELLKPSPDMRVLDIATGAGHTALTVAPFVREVVASDLVAEMLAQTQKLIEARSATNVTTHLADAEALPFPDASFDAVTCRIAPHHFIDIEKALGEIARVLKPGGVFVLEDSCAPEARRHDAFINALEKLRDPTHVRSYTKSQWKGMLAKAGLPVVRLRNYRKQHDVADWVERSGLPAAQQALVYAAFAAAPAWARKRFAITCDGDRAMSYSDDKVILRAVKQ